MHASCYVRLRYVAVVVYVHVAGIQVFTCASTHAMLRPFEQYLSHGSLNDIILDDRADFASTDAAMGSMGVSAQERTQIYTLVAGVLHLGTLTTLPCSALRRPLACSMLRMRATDRLSPDQLLLCKLHTVQ